MTEEELNQLHSVSTWKCVRDPEDKFCFFCFFYGRQCEAARWRQKMILTLTEKNILLPNPIAPCPETAKMKEFPGKTLSCNHKTKTFFCIYCRKKYTHCHICKPTIAPATEHQKNCTEYLLAKEKIRAKRKGNCLNQAWHKDEPCTHQFNCIAAEYCGHNLTNRMLPCGHTPDSEKTYTCSQCGQTYKHCWSCLPYSSPEDRHKLICPALKGL